MKILFYTGPHCELCDLAQQELEKTAYYSSLEIEMRNVRDNTQWYHYYGVRIPVLKRVDNENEIGWPFDSQMLEAFLQ